MKTIFVSAIVLAVISTSWAYSYVGCYVDQTTRILEGSFTSATDMTIEKCMQKCSLEGKYFAGLEYGGQCLCGNNLKEYNKLADTECSTPCTGDNTQKCGATWKISVYTTNVNYLGCYVDNSTRMLEGSVYSNAAMTTQMCIQHCQNQNKRFALTQYTSQCFCGNHLKPFAKVAESDCDYNCGGKPNEKCGGFWRGSLYLIHYNAL